METRHGTHLRLVTGAKGAEVGPLASAAPARSATASKPIDGVSASLRALRHHWPEYAMEAFGLGLFMLSACVFGAILDYPGSPVHHAIPDATLRRVLFGAAMALTNIGNIYSPWGKRSGAHLNPAVSWTFFRLGKVERADAIFYTLSQFGGGVLGVFVARLFLRPLIAHPAVNYVATAPGAAGVGIAFVAEAAITFVLMSVILTASNSARLSRYTGILASLLVMIYISVEAPLSGMSMNPARTLGSAVFAGTWTALWVYFVAPPLGMLLAAEVYLRLNGARQVFCAKLHHHNNARCIFRCRFMELGN
ncbi:MAG TPA: aquaporin [Blastocatellia bacterium]|nr:aquaporin [Blastocatellia bacterium]